MYRDFLFLMRHDGTLLLLQNLPCLWPRYQGLEIRHVVQGMSSGFILMLHNRITLGPRKRQWPSIIETRGTMPGQGSERRLQVFLECLFAGQGLLLLVMDRRQRVIDVIGITADVVIARAHIMLVFFSDARTDRTTGSSARGSTTG